MQITSKSFNPTENQFNPSDWVLAKTTDLLTTAVLE